MEGGCDPEPWREAFSGGGKRRGGETRATSRSKCFHKGEEAVVKGRRCIWSQLRERLRVLFLEFFFSQKQMECQPLRKINEAAIGAN